MTSSDPNFDEFVLPDAVLAELRRSDYQPTVPPALDREVRSATRAYFARQRSVRRWVRVGSSIAATILIAVGLVALRPGSRSGGVAQRPADTRPASSSGQKLADASALANAVTDPFDTDGDGRVDILDAFTVARGIRDGRTDLRWDVTGDGRVDQSDIDVIASRAVKAAEKPEAVSAPGIARPR